MNNVIVKLFKYAPYIYILKISFVCLTKKKRNINNNNDYTL